MVIADDSSVFVNDDEGIRIYFKVIKWYENATGAKLNKGKASILGIGNWKGRKNWPCSELKILENSCKI